MFIMKNIFYQNQHMLNQANLDCCAFLRSPAMTKKAFSLAEVMITLVIIGVISMLVVPNLLDNASQRVNIASASKADLEVHQAALRIQGECIRWRCIDSTVNPPINLYNMLA